MNRNTTAENFVSGDVRCILSHIPTRPDYDEWMQVISAVTNLLPLTEAVQALANWSAEEKTGEYTTHARSFQGKTPSGMAAGHLINIAKRHGFDASAFARERRQRDNLHVGKPRFARPSMPPALERHGGGGGETICGAGGGDRVAVSSNPPPSSVPHQPHSLPAPLSLKLPRDLRPCNDNELYTIADIRELPDLSGLKAATAAGVLFYGTLSDTTAPDSNTWEYVPAWIVTDSSRQCALARRLDGKPWNCINDKARCIKHASPDRKPNMGWPINLAAAIDRPDASICIVEGTPDLLAAFYLPAIAPSLADAVPVAMAAAGNNIDPTALPFFAGRRVVLFFHNDGAGRAATQKRHQELTNAGAALIHRLDYGKRHSTRLQRPPKDLNEVISCWHRSDLTPNTPDTSPFRTPTTPHPAAPNLCPDCSAAGVIAPRGGLTCRSRHNSEKL